MEHLYWDLGQCAGGAQFEVSLKGSTARVCLMTADEYDAYVGGDEYECYGGFYDWSPVILDVPHDDYWYVVVDSYRRRIRVAVDQVFD